MKQYIENYAVYYGYDKIERLKEYDLVIVDSNGQSKDNIDFLKQNNTITIAYISVLEINKDFLEYKYLRDEDFLTINNRRIVNTEFKNYLVDLKSKRYISMLIHKIGDLLMNKGFQGIFLDTVGDIEFQVIPEDVKNSLINELVKLLETIKKMFPECIIIQNNGINIVKHTNKYVDIFMLENPTNEGLGLLPTRNSLANFVIELSRNNRIKVFILFEEKNKKRYEQLSDDIVNLYDEKNILLYLSKENYLDI